MQNKFKQYTKWIWVARNLGENNILAITINPHDIIWKYTELVRGDVKRISADQRRVIVHPITAVDHKSNSARFKAYWDKLTPRQKRNIKAGLKAQ